MDRPKNALMMRTKAKGLAQSTGSGLSAGVINPPSTTPSPPRSPLFFYYLLATEEKWVASSQVTRCQRHRFIIIKRELHMFFMYTEGGGAETLRAPGIF